MATATHIINRIPPSLLQSLSPFESLFSKKSDYSTFRVFGCVCHPFLRPYNRHKFQFHSSECTFLGYSPHHKGYRCLDSSGRVYMSKDVIFHETTFPSQEHSKIQSPQPQITHNYPLIVLKPPTISHCPSSPMSSPPSSFSSTPFQHPTPTAINTPGNSPIHHSPIPSS